MCNEKCVFPDVKKIKVSREVVHAIECVKRECYGFDSAINIHIKNGWTSEEKLALRKLSTEEFATALIVGYEVEMTPHEKIAKEYADAEQERLAGLDAEDTCLIYQNLGIEMGIEFTLNALGVVVEGVNDN